MRPIMRTVCVIVCIRVYAHSRLVLVFRSSLVEMLGYANIHWSIKAKTGLELRFQGTYVVSTDL